MEFACFRKHEHLTNAFIVISAAVILTLNLITPLSAGTLEDAAIARDRGDFTRALRLYRSLADQGDAAVADAQNNLGVMYDAGLGVPQDDAEAAKWYRKAADQGLASAQYNLGVMHAKGRGVPQDDAEAVKFRARARAPRALRREAGHAGLRAYGCHPGGEALRARCCASRTCFTGEYPSFTARHGDLFSNWCAYNCYRVSRYARPPLGRYGYSLLPYDQDLTFPHRAARPHGGEGRYLLAK